MLCIIYVTSLYIIYVIASLNESKPQNRKMKWKNKYLQTKILLAYA